MSLKQQYLFVKKLEALYKTNKSLALSIENLAKHEPKSSLRRAFAEIADYIKQGSSLSKALSDVAILDEVYCRLIHVGEKSGKLDNILIRILDQIDTIIKIRRKVLSAAVYPIAIITVYSGIALLFLLILVPVLAGYLTDLGRDLPMTFKVIMAIANPMNCCCCLPVWFLLCAALGYIFFNIELFDDIRERIVLFIPGFGRIAKFSNLLSFVSTMKICYESGMSIFEAMELSILSFKNSYMADKFYGAYESLKQGSIISDAIAGTGFFDYEMADLIRVGEESGTLEESYNEIIKMLNVKINDTIAVMIAIVKPMGLVLGIFMLIGFFLLIGSLLLSILSSVKNALPF